MNGNDSGATWLSVALLIAFWCSAWGWGRGVGRFFPVPLLRLNSISIVVGLAALNVLGGWLNVVRLATAPVLATIMAIGLVFLAIDLTQSFRRRRRLRSLRQPQDVADEKPAATAVSSGRAMFGGNRRLASFAPLLVAVGIGLFTISLLVPTSVFNVQDDFQAYMVRALRLAQTGTLGGSPFETVGLDSLGAQSLFHAFFFPQIDVRLMHMFDAVGCFMVALLLVGEMAMVWRVPVLAGVMAVFAVAAINPQSVNISPLYSGVVVAMALMVCGAAAAADIASPLRRGNTRYEVIVGLLAALLVALKLTLAFFAAMYLAALYVGLLLTIKPARAVLKSAGVTALAVAIGIAPWLILHVPTILHARNLAVPFTPDAVLTSKYGSLASHDIPKLLSLRPLYWGDSIATYHSVVLLCLVAAVVAALIWRAKRAQPRTYGLLSVVAAALAALGCYFWNANLFEIDDAIRYTLPPLIAVAPLGWLCLHKFSGLGGAKRTRPLNVAMFCVMIVIVAMFGKSMGTRVRVAAEHRTTLAYPLSERYVDYCRRTTSPDARQSAHALQEKMEPGATILMSVAAPFHFDFSRNRVLTATEAGLVSPVIRFPAGISNDALRKYLRSYGIRYVLFQRRGEGVKTIDMLRPKLTWDNVIYRKLADYGIYYRESMSSLAAQSEVLFENDRILLFDLSKAR